MRNAMVLAPCSLESTCIPSRLSLPNLFLFSSYIVAISQKNVLQPGWWQDPDTAMIWMIQGFSTCKRNWDHARFCIYIFSAYTRISISVGYCRDLNHFARIGTVAYQDGNNYVMIIKRSVLCLFRCMAGFVRTWIRSFCELG